MERKGHVSGYWTWILFWIMNLIDFDYLVFIVEEFEMVFRSGAFCDVVAGQPGDLSSEFVCQLLQPLNGRCSYLG